MKMGREEMPANIAPTNHLTVCEGHEHWIAPFHEAKQELARLRQRERLKERQIFSLASDGVYGRPVAFDVFRRDGNDIGRHQRRGHRLDSWKAALMRLFPVLRCARVDPERHMQLDRGLR